MSQDEIWIDTRESTMNPDAVNSSSGALGLGQLLPQTYRNLGLPISYNPCDELGAQRKYIAERYGSTASARSFWERNHSY